MIQQIVQPGQTLLLDSDAIIYFLEDHPRYGSAAQDILASVRDGELQSFASTLAFAEVLVPAYRKDPLREGPQLAETLRSIPNLYWIDLDARLASAAARLRAAYGLRTPDAVHVATALSVKADWIVTNDKGLRRVRAEGVKVWLFDEATA